MPYAHRLDHGRPARLRHIDPDERAGLDKEKGEQRTEKLAREMSELLDLLYFAGQNGLLLVLQGRDTAGKDGLVRHLLAHSNVQSARVEPFKVPTPTELDHDFLWRVHARTPGRGEVVLFNRSHYEDVLVVRVHGLTPEPVWRARYAHINHFEHLLLDAGVILLKFFLHISPEEQEERLLEREKETAKAWKLSVGDWKEREHWEAYTAAYEEALRRCATRRAPWFVIPANHKWFRDLAVTECVVQALRPYRKRWLAHLEQLGTSARAELETFRAEHTPERRRRRHR